MVRYKKGFGKVILSFIVLFLCLSVNSIDGQYFFPEIQRYDTVLWKVEYLNTIDPTKNNVISSSIIAITIEPDRIEYYYSEESIGHYGGYIYPEMTIRNFPLGTTEDILALPSIESILTNISFISIDWNENAQLFINGSYSPYQEYNIENPAESLFIYNNLFFFKGAFRKTCIFRHNFHDNNTEDFKLLGFGVEGYMEAVYLYNSGVLLQYEFHVVIPNSGHSFDLSIKLLKTTINLELSKWSKIIITFGVLAIPYLGIGITGNVIFIVHSSRKKRNLVKETEAKELEKIELEKEIKVTQRNLEGEYIFIEKCPFCNKEYPASISICPYCKGKK